MAVQASAAPGRPGLGRNRAGRLVTAAASAYVELCKCAPSGRFLLAKPGRECYSPLRLGINKETIMAQPMMPKATAVWLVENTTLTFEQIADFCGLHPLEVQAIADGEVATQMQGLDPVANGQTTAEEIERCQADPSARLKLSERAQPQQFVKHKGPRYTPISKRQDKPDAIMYLLRTHPELSDAQISKLIGTTKPTIAAVRDRTHWNKDIKPRHPVGLGLCTMEELDRALARAQRARGQPERQETDTEESEAVET